MFNSDFFPTPQEVVEKMLALADFTNKVVLEPSAGKGDIIDHLPPTVKSIIACEIEPDLRKILSGKCQIIGEDFLKVTSDMISHVDIIIMNPPFSTQVKHLKHVMDIAPKGCKVISLANEGLFERRDTYMNRREVVKFINSNGHYELIGDVFKGAERSTDVNVALIYFTIPGGGYEKEFDGFFMGQEEEGQYVSGLMSYNVIRDIVNRYVESVKLFDRVQDSVSALNSMSSLFMRESFGGGIVSYKGVESTRDTVKKVMQKNAWDFIFKKMNMEKYLTRSLKEEINKFVEKQHNVPFTMRNIYVMIDMVVQTHGERMNRSLVDAFDKITERYHENRYSVPGWKTNSNYIVNKRFIMDSIVEYEKRWDWNGDAKPKVYHSEKWAVGMVEDLLKGICYIMGRDYNKEISLYTLFDARFKIVDENGDPIADPIHKGYFVPLTNRSREILEIDQKKFPGSTIREDETEWGQWVQWGSYFRVKPYKKGSMHFEFLDENVWFRYNQRISEIKGHPLPDEFIRGYDRHAKKGPRKNKESVGTDMVLYNDVSEADIL